jgi:hypothetical protein
MAPPTKGKGDQKTRKKAIPWSQAHIDKAPQYRKMSKLRQADIDWLTRNNLAHWIQPLERLIEMYEGIEDFQDNLCDNPKTWVRNLISRVKYIKNWDSGSKNQYLHERILDCPLWYWRARVDTERWQPFEETLEEFGRRGRMLFWEKGIPDPPKDEIQRWLDEQITAK